MGSTTVLLPEWKKSMGMAWWKTEGMKTQHFPLSLPQQADVATVHSTYTTIYNMIFSCFDTKRFPFVVSLLVIHFMMSTKNSNRCDEILSRGTELQREGTGITDETGKEMGIQPG